MIYPQRLAAKTDIYAEAAKYCFCNLQQLAGRCGRTSSLLKGFKIEAIPNPIDTELYSPQNKTTARDRYGIEMKTKVILFGRPILCIPVKA